MTTEQVLAIGPEFTTFLRPFELFFDTLKTGAWSLEEVRTRPERRLTGRAPNRVRRGHRMGAAGAGNAGAARRPVLTTWPGRPARTDSESVWGLEQTGGDWWRCR
jgi:hypothetical protein